MSIRIVFKINCFVLFYCSFMVYSLVCCDENFTAREICHAHFSQVKFYTPYKSKRYLISFLLAFLL